MIPNIGPMEIAIVAVIGLIVFGPKRLPELGRSVGQGLREFRGSVTGAAALPATADAAADADGEEPAGSAPPTARTP